MDVITDCSVVWLDDDDIDGKDLALNIQFYVSFSFRIFTELAPCLSFIKHCTSDTRLLLIVLRDRYVNEMLNKTSRLQTSNLTIFFYVLGDKWLFSWAADTHVRGIFHISEENRLVNKLRDDFKAHIAQRWSSGYCVFTENAPQVSLDKMDKENANFMWFQLLTEVLLRMPTNAKSKDELLQQSFLVYSTNQAVQEQILEFHQRYQSKDALEQYTKNGFTYRLFNQACRTDDIDLLYNFRFFLKDLHNQLKQVYNEQHLMRSQQETITVYRGTIISKDELKILQSPTNGQKIIWLNTFASTSLKEEVARKFLDPSPPNDQVSVLQEIKIDAKIDFSSTPFGFMANVGVINSEEEVLLSIGTALELESIKENDDNPCVIKLRMVNYKDRIREELRLLLEEDIEEPVSLITLSAFLFRRGDFEKCIKYNKLLLKELPINDVDLPRVHNNLGYAFQKMHKLDESLHHLNESINMFLSLDSSHYIKNFNRNLACAYNNKGLVLMSLDEFNEALQCIEKSLDLRRDDDTLTEQQRKCLAVERSYSHENLGLAYLHSCKYELSLCHLQNALDIRKQYLPANRFMIAQVYNNLSRIYTALGNAEKSFECAEQALTLQIQSLPENHPHRGSMYNSLGEAYLANGRYALALSCFQKALDIYKKGRSRSAFNEAIALSNIGWVMKVQRNFDGALERFLHAYTVIESVQPRHHFVARCLNNIGSAYRDKGNYLEATVHFNRAIEFCQSYLSENNEVTAISYSNRASVLTETEHKLAIEYLDRTVSIYNSLGLPHHRNVMISYIDRGLWYRKIHDHQAALVSYEKALFHCEKAVLPQRHLVRFRIHTTMALEYRHINNYAQAIIEYEHALQCIGEESVEEPQIRSAIETCQQKLIEYDVNQALQIMLDAIEKLE